jgi:hypothetical protein
VPQTKAEPVAEVALPDPCVALRNDWESQNPVLVGLIAQFAGVTLQEDIEPMLRHLHSRGRVILNAVPLNGVSITVRRTYLASCALKNGSSTPSVGNF